MKDHDLRLCLVEDDPIMGESLCYRFELEGIPHDWHRSGQDALAAIQSRPYAVVVSDIRLGDMNGEELYERLLAAGRRLPAFLFITGYGSIDHAVRLLKLGATDYITKPFDLDSLIEKIRSLVPTVSVRSCSRCVEGQLGISPLMRKIEEELCRFSGHDATVLITGESGVGKEHAARRLHHCATSAGTAPFIAINCAAVPENLLEAELFGHEKGAFTGAVRVRKGLFEQAQGGTLFLDEVGEMTASMQAKLLRVIQEREVVRIGGDQAIAITARLVCATNRDLKKMVEQGEFREDLYYRINVLHVHLPPLRERQEDILWFARRFVDEFSQRTAGDRRSLSIPAERALLAHDWPGNLRELAHRIERACIMSDQALLPASAFAELCVPEEGGALTEGRLREQLDHYERQVILQALHVCQFHIAETANHLGISRKNLWEKMKKFGIEH